MGVETISWKMYVNIDLFYIVEFKEIYQNISLFQPYVIAICKAE
jgi:hypothetical protein